LLQRVFGFEVLVCDRCGGPRRILGAVTEPHAVRRLFAALALAAEPPPSLPSRPADPPVDRVHPGSVFPVRLPDRGRGFRPHPLSSSVAACQAAPPPLPAWPAPRYRSGRSAGGGADAVSPRAGGRGAEQGRRNVLWTSYVLMAKGTRFQ